MKSVAFHIAALKCENIVIKEPIMSLNTISEWAKFLVHQNEIHNVTDGPVQYWLDV